MITKQNIPSMSAEKAVQSLTQAYCNIIKSGVGVKNFPSVMLWGAPGVGKSQAVKQIARNIQSITGKKVAVTDVRLLLFNPIDLRGIPTSNADKTLAVWLKPQIFQMDESANTVNILFMDELSAAPQSVQAAAYQIALDRLIGEHKLPDNCIVISAGNRVTDRSVAFKMPRALANRLLHIEVDVNFTAWEKWAITSGISGKVLGFLSFRNDYLLANADTTADDLAFATPRSWEMVSNVLKTMNDDVETAYPFIAGLVGIGTAIEFRTWAKVYATLPKIEDIFAGKTMKLPANTDAMYALISSMVCYAREHKDNLTEIKNSIIYASKMPADFSAVLFRDYMYIDSDYKMKLVMIPEFRKWLESKGKLLNENN